MGVSRNALTRLADVELSGTARHAAGPGTPAPVPHFTH